MLEGTRIGSYEITAHIGAGGMGEVYRARDTRLGRDVALKILPDAFAADPDRLARFQREAQVLASLNHPHIASIYGLEEAAPLASGQAAVRALVLELVEGPTLADRIAQGPIPLDQALAIAKQIAEALDAAHEAGIVHRDLKPANVKVKADGTVKVLDFGLAKAVEGAGEAGRAGVAGGENLSQSPTITTPAMTAMGMILGTAAYMAPEQAKGRRVDKRVDVWALGALLYEMLAGRRAFGRDGDDVADTLAAVLRAEPDWTKLPATTPQSIGRLLRRSLEKDVRLRLSDMAMVQLELRDASNPEVGIGTAVTAAKPSFVRRAMPYAAVVATAAATAAIVWRVRAPVEEVRPIVRYSIDLPEKMQLSSPNRDAVAISPDGTRIAYAANNRLYVRSLDQTEARPIEGTEAGGLQGYARLPFFSPDGQWVGFWQQGALKKVSVSSGIPSTICEVSGGVPLSASWEPEGEILLSVPGGVVRVPASGGTPEVVIKADNVEGMSSVRALPGGKWIFFVYHHASMSLDQGEVVVQNRSTGERRVLVKGARDARYVPTGHIVFGRGSTLFAQAFDAGRLAVNGSPVPVLEGVAGAATNTNPILHFALSSNGTIVYVPESTAGTSVKTNLVQVLRNGSRLPLEELAGAAWFPRVSPDGTRVAYGLGASADLNESSDIWVVDLARGARTRVTFTGNNRFYPIWTRDGTRLTYADGTGATNQILWSAADGTGHAEVLLKNDGRRYPTSWSQDGHTLAYYLGGFSVRGAADAPSRDIWMLRVDGGKRTEMPFIQEPFEERGAIFSPNGRWVAYVSTKSGQNDVYARPFSGGGEVTISVGGGQEPVWAPSGRELFYRNAGKLWSVTISETATALTVSAPSKVFDDPYRLDTGGAAGGMANYDILPNGQRFIMVEEPKATGGEAPTVHVQVILNWQDELKRRAPAR